MDYLYASLKEVAERLALPPLKQLALAPGTKAVYRITCYSINGRLHHSVGTLTAQLGDAPLLTVVYEGLFAHKPLEHRLAASAYERWSATLTQLSFDKLTHQSGLAHCQQSVWLVEKGVNTFYHSVLLSPERPQPPYSTIINAIDAYLPEAIRDIAR